MTLLYYTQNQVPHNQSLCKDLSISLDNCTFLQKSGINNSQSIRKETFLNRFHINAVLICSFLFIISQPTNGQVRVLGGVSVPFGNFARVDSATGGYASTGFSVGTEIVSKFLLDSELGFSGILCLYPFNVKAFLQSQPSLPKGVPIESGPWILIWPTASFGYTYPFSDFLSIYGRVHAGLFYGIYPEISITEFGSPKITRNLSIKVAFGSGIGVGGIINKKFDVGIRFLSALPDYDLNTPGGILTTEKSTIDTYTLNIMLGYIF